MSNLIHVAQTLYSNRAEIVAAVGAIAGGVGALCTLLAHLPFVPANLQVKFARAALWSSKQFQITKGAGQ